MERVRGMLRWMFIFLVLAVVTGLLGFVVLVGVIAGIVKILFLAFLGLVVITLVMRFTRGASEEIEE
jgi:uncharacterized membrane protein YtjA (UPF0391 family)